MIMATPVNGPISMFDVQSTFGLGYNLNAYRDKFGIRQTRCNLEHSRQAKFLWQTFTIKQM